MDRRRAARAVGRPRDRPVERPVHLEHARSIAEPLGPAPCRATTADRRRSRRAGAASTSSSDRAGRRQLARATPTRWSVTTSPPAASSSATSAVGHGPTPAADHRPADRVGIGREDQPERGTQRAIEAEHRVGGDPGEQRPRRLVLGTGRGPARAPTAAPAARSGPAPAGAAGRGRPAAGSPGPSLSTSRTSGPNNRAPRPPVRPAETLGGGRDRPLEHRRPPAIERMRDRRIRVDQLDAAGGQVHGPRRTARRVPAAGSSSTCRGGTRGASAPSSASRRRPSGPPRRRGPSARHGPA